MSCAQNDIIFIGQFEACEETFVTTITAEQTEDLTLEYEILGRLIKIPVEAVEGEPLEIPNQFNEYADVIFKLKRADGTYYDDKYRIKIH